MTIHRIATQINRYRVTSLLIHICVFVAIGALLRYIPRSRLAVVPHRIETAQHLVLSLPGSVEAGSPKAPPPKDVAPLRVNSTLHTAPTPSNPGRLSPTPQTCEGISGHSAWGKGEIRRPTCQRCAQELRVMSCWTL